MAARRGPEVVEDRRIAPGDVVEVRAESRAEASRAYTVSRKGTIRLPGAGEVKIADQTDDEATAVIGRAIGAAVNVRLVEATGGEATIAGAVEQPGTLRLGSRGKTLLDALAVTGGLTAEASGIIRITPASAAAGGEPIEIDADDVLRGGENGPARLYLRAGDRIDVLSSDGEVVATGGPDPIAELGFATADAPDGEELRELEPPSEPVVRERPPVAPEPVVVARPEPTRPPEEDSAEVERRQRELAEWRAQAERSRREFELERRRNEELSVRIAELEADRARPTPQPMPEPTLEPMPEPTLEPLPEPTLWPTREPMPMPTRAPMPMPTLRPTREPMRQPTREPTRPPPPRVSNPNSRIAVIGRVRSPGAQRLGEGRTVTRAVARAGLAEGADVTRIEVRRDDGVRSSTIVVNLLEVRAGRSPDLLLEAGDTIIVP